MEVIPLTLALSLLLSLTFIVLFVREFARPRRAGAEHDSLLPLEDDAPANVAFATRHTAESGRVAAPVHNHAHPEISGRGHDHASGEKCSGGKPGVACCSSCQRRKDRVAARASVATKA